MANRSEKVQVIFSLKNDTFNKSLAETKSQIKLTQSQLKATGTEMKTYGSNLTTLSKKHDLLKTQISNVTEKMNKYKDAITKNSKTLEENKIKLEALNKEKKSLTTQYKEAVKLYGEESTEAKTLKDALENVKNEYNDMNDKIKTNVKNLNSHQTQMNNSKTELNNLQRELKATNKEIAEQSSKFIAASKNFQKLGNTLNTIGGGMSSVGSKLMTLSAPIAGISAYAIKVGMDFESSMAQVQATSSASAKEIEKLSETSKNLGKDIKGASAKDVADSFNYLALAGYNVDQMLSAIEPNVKASIAFNADMATTSDLTTDSLSALGLAAEDTSRYLDIVAQTSRNANTSGTQLMEAYIGCGGMFRELNTPLEESSTLLGILANRGIKSSEAGTSMNSVLINLMGVAGQSAEALETLGLSAYDSEGNFKGVTNVLRELKTRLGQCTEEQRQQFEAMIGGKTQIDTLSALLDGLDKEYGTLNTSIQGSNGALEEMYNTMSDTTAGNIEELMGNLESLGIELAETLLPHVNDLVGSLDDLVTWFRGLDKETQSFILKAGLFTFATGGMLKVVGSTTKSIGELSKGISKATGFIGKLLTSTSKVEKGLSGASAGVSALTGGVGALSSVMLPVIGTLGVVAAGMYAVHEAEDVAKSSCVKTKEEFSATEKIMAKFTGTTLMTKAELQELGLVAKDLPDTLSKDFKKAMEEATQDLHEFNISLNEITLDNVITDEERSTFNSKVENLCNSAIETINAKKEEVQSSLNSTFSADGVIDENERTLLTFYDEQAEKSKNKVQEMQQKINAIWKKTEQDGYVLTEEDKQNIQNYYQQIEQIKLEAQAKNHYDEIYAREKWNLDVENITAKQAEKLIKERKETYNKQQAEDEAYYKSSIELIKMHYDDMNDEQKAAADREIQQLQTEQAKKTEERKKTFDEDIKYLEDHNENLKGRIDLINGTIMSNGDVAASKHLETVKKYYDGINDITKTGMYTLYNTDSQSWEQVYVKVDEMTGQIIQVVGNYTNDVASYKTQIAGYNEEEEASAEKLADKYASSGTRIIAALNDTYNTHINSKGQIINADDEIVGSLDKVEGKAGTVRKGFLDINGTKVQVTINKDDTIRSLDSIEYKLKEVTRNRTIKIAASLANGLASGLSGIGGYETGGLVEKAGVYKINESGPELFDNLGLNNISLGYASGSNEVAYLNSGTKVTNALMTTAKMENMIRNNVDTTTAKAINSLASSIGVEIIKALSTKNNDNNLDMDQVINIYLGDRELTKVMTDKVIKRIDKKYR